MNLKALTTFPEDKVRALAGLTHTALAKLLLEALPEIERRRQQEQANKPRKRKVGGGRKRLLSYLEASQLAEHSQGNLAYMCTFECINPGVT